MKAYRRSVKPGSYLDKINALGIVQADKELTATHNRLTGIGFTLTPTLRPYYAKSGFISFNFTWRVRLDTFMRETA